MAVSTRHFRTGRDRSRPVRAQLPVSTRGQLERSFRILETTSRHGTSGRDRSRSVAPCQIYRVDARVGATDLSANQPLLAHAFLIYFFPFWAHVRFHVSSIDCVMLKPSMLVARWLLDWFIRQFVRRISEYITTSTKG